LLPFLDVAVKESSILASDDEEDRDFHKRPSKKASATNASLLLMQSLS